MFPFRIFGLSSLLAGVPLLGMAAQLAPESTRFTIHAAPILSQPKGEFGRNIGSGFGGGGGVSYHLDRSGLISLRFDISGTIYGREKRRVAISETIGERLTAELTTTNSITTIGIGPEVALPRGPVRPYVNTGFGGLFFRTGSSVTGSESSEPFARTTNYSDSAPAWFFGSGVRIPLAGDNPRKAISLDLGLRYYRGGAASYLREGSIQDHPGGSISLTPLSSRTPHVVYVVGIRFRIPHNAATPCHRLVC